MKKSFKTIDPKSVSTPEFHGYLLGAVTPRPIAFASTVDKEGNVNLSPFSFFNAFGANPPTLIFSPARRVRNNTTKDTLENAKSTKEVCISIVSYDIVEQMSLSSTEYDTGVNEFKKSGLTERPSSRIKAPGVLEAPACFECKVTDIIETGSEGGAGNLIICEVLLAHIDKSILDEKGKIDPFKLDSVGRMGGNWYVRAQGDALFEIAKPLRNKGIGVDNIPEHIRHSDVLTGNNLGQLGNVEAIPEENEVIEFRQNEEISEILNQNYNDRDVLRKALHIHAQKLLSQKKVNEAWLTLLQD
ncbi:MAG: flavin reductase family protein [Cytophagales bacterium]